MAHRGYLRVRRAGFSRRRARTNSRSGPLVFASVYPLVTARAVAREFTYEVDDGVGVGAVVRVPFGRSRARGIVTRLVDAPPPGNETRPLGAGVGENPAAPLEPPPLAAHHYRPTPPPPPPPGPPGGPPPPQGAG